MGNENAAGNLAIIHYVSADDWQAVYVDDVCVHQGHSVPQSVWFDLLKRGPFEIDATHDESELAYDVADTDGQFPDSYAELIARQEPA